MSALVRNIFRGWARSESFWDKDGMDENLRFIGDHLPVNIVTINGERPLYGSEGDCHIYTSTGNYSVWSTGPKLQAPVWNDYQPAAGLVAMHSATGDLWGNNGSSWINVTEAISGSVEDFLDEAAVLALISHSLVSGINTTVTGSGTQSAPFMVNVPTDEVAIQGRGYRHTAVDGSSVLISAPVFISEDAGNAITAGDDGGLKVVIPAQLPDDQVFSGDNSGTVALTMTPVVDPVTGDTDYTVKADLKVAAFTPIGAENFLKWSPSGFYVEIPELLDVFE